MSVLGMALSRIWLWAFDLCQLKVLQTTLNNHPRRNSLCAISFSNIEICLLIVVRLSRSTALQIALQNVADLLKYVLTIVLSRPLQFRFAALVSGVSVLMGALSYTLYAWRERGHLVHTDAVKHLLDSYKDR